MEVHWEQPPAPGIQAHLPVPAQFPPAEPQPVKLLPPGTPGQPCAPEARVLKAPKHAIRRAGGQVEPRHAAARASRPSPSRGLLGRAWSAVAARLGNPASLSKATANG
ncbi:MAG TPA: hypothetical protein VME19_14210 [Streptosporangiaceae bacterium]|nr:hypothetical protein [Streptosporangiaceae bacterium]